MKGLMLILGMMLRGRWLVSGMFALLLVFSGGVEGFDCFEVPSEV